MTVSLAEAQSLAGSVIARAGEQGLTIGVSVVNERAGTVLVAGMDGARPFTPDTAHGKALCCGRTDLSSGRIEQARARARDRI